ncbi:hypothetical protein ADUPG1_003805, partial [Aduncisulcus paluster]
NMALDLVLPDDMKRKIRAFADDIIILSTSLEAEEDTRNVVNALARYGLAVNPFKCFTLGDTRVILSGSHLTSSDPAKHKDLGLAATTCEPLRIASRRKLTQVLSEVDRITSLPFTGTQMVEAFN